MQNKIRRIKLMQLFFFNKIFEVLYLKQQINVHLYPLKNPL